MSIFAKTNNDQVPITLVEYAAAHTAQGTAICILSLEDDDGFYWIATGLDSDLNYLHNKGFETVTVYTPANEPLYDNLKRYAYGDDRCC